MFILYKKEFILNLTQTYYLETQSIPKMNRLFSTELPKDIVRQNSDVKLEKDSLRAKQMRQMRQMKSVNKQLVSRKKHFFFEEGEKIIGDYKFDPKKQIGSGYSSKVYKAISLKNNNQFAIKVIELKNFKPSHFEMLENEIKILKKLSHPNVLKFQSVSKTPTHLYIITEFCQKGDLLTYMTRKGNLKENQALQIFSDIVKGLQYLQKLGIIHRDIKPGNILHDGKNWKIADFGFSIESKEEIKTRNNVGTPLYMPIESLEKNLYSPESDIFSTGVVLYEMLIGITPWECRDQIQLIRKLKQVQFKIPQKIKISQYIKELLKKLCEPLKQNRMNVRQFSALDPLTFKNFESTNNAFRNEEKFQANQQSKIKMSPDKGQNKRKISTKKSGEEFKILQLRQKKQEKPKNQINLFANGKMKRSQQNVKNQHVTSTKQLAKIKSASNLFASQVYLNKANEESPLGKANVNFKQRAQKTNKNILFALLNLCRFMYYLMKNSQYLELNDLNRQKTRVLLLKHSIFVLKQLVDSEHNWFGLQNYDTYKETKNYLRLYSSFQEYLVKYEKQYDQLMKKTDGSVTKQINQKMSELSLEEGLTMDESGYKKILSFIAPILRQNNHNLASEIINNKKKMTEETKFKIEAIKNLFKYYQLLQMLCKENSSIQYFEQNSNIQVVKTYSQSTASIEEFMNLRKEMKYI